MRTVKHDQLSTPTPKPGQQEWLERYGDYIQAAHHWRLAGILSLIVAAILSVGIVMIAGQSQVVPYVVKVDGHLGSAVAVDRADIAIAPDKAIIVAQLARWVSAVRSVYTDGTAQRTLIQDAYAMIDVHGAAYGVINDYMRAHDPFERAKSEIVSIEVQAVLPISESSWRIEWREEIRARDGTRTDAAHYEAVVTVSFNPPNDEATIRLNPSGLYISGCSWTKRLEGQRP
jgi:type IV secretion system protein TrbF